ncbi:MAG: MMPL family transporter [Patulibacter sp.]|nr:MMPL family transporter [Patulibacter sp.]
MWLVDRCLRHPRGVGILAVVVLALAVFGLTQLGTSAAVRTVVGTGSPAYQAERDAAERFGDETILVLVRQSAADIGLTEDLATLALFEQCLAGTVPDDEPLPGGDDGPCAALAQAKPAQVVYGPGTFATTGVDAINAEISGAAAEVLQKLNSARTDAEAAAKEAGKSSAEVEAAGDRAQREAEAERDAGLATAARYGIDPLGGGASLESTQLISRLLFDPGAEIPGTPRARFLPIFPTRDVGLVAMRLRADLTADEQREAVGWVQQAVKLDDFALAQGGSYVVSGSPVLVAAIADELQHALILLLAVGVLVMALVLALTFPERRRLQPLLLALGTVAVVFGGTGLLGWSIDLGTIATLPVLLGLAVDYGVQLHARVEEHRRAGLDREAAVRAAVARGGRPILLAAGATLAGFLALLASPTPLVRGFALVLIAGVALAVLASFTFGLVLHARRPRKAREAADGDSSPAPAVPAAAHRGVGRTVAVRRLVSWSYRWPRTVLTVGVVLAVGGAVVGSHERVETELQRLVPSDLQAVQDATLLQEQTGQAGEVRVLIEGDDLATPEALGWIDDYRQKALEAAGYDRARGCADADLCPLSVSFRDLLGQDPSTQKDGAAVRELLGETPAYFVRSSLTDDRTSALISFGLPLGSTEEQEAVLDRLRDQLDPPAGVTATVTGLPVLFADASSAISSPTRRILTLVGSLVLVGGLLLVATRSRRRGLVPVLPVALAAGWCGLLTWLLGLPLNPLSVVLGALIVAIGTEFAVLLTERYHQERDAGYSDVDAIARAAASTGSAVGASAATTIAGFAVLAVSDIPLLRQFGLITVLELVVAVLAVMIVLPAVAGVAARRRARRAARGTAGASPVGVEVEAAGR